MKRYHHIMLGVILLLAAVFIGVNLFLSMLFYKDNNRTYRVEINRLQNEIAQKGMGSIKLEQYNCVKNITVLEEGKDEPEFFEGNGSDYIIKKIGISYYRFDYEVMLTNEYHVILLTINAALGTMAAIVLGVMIFLQEKLLKPFHIISDLPYELSKGNLTAGLKENKSRFFGKFLWGLDLLRESLEKQKEKELSLQKEKKTLVLSISHDIKTPLSAINLYAKALSRDLYKSDEKRMEAAENISIKVKEIEGFVSDIIKTSSEEFLSFKVDNGEFYMNSLLKKISNYYTEKLSLYGIDFRIEDFRNCLIRGDINRAVEVLQNIIENAIKYGDGGSITIAVTSEEDCRLISIMNSGCSLPENELPHIFESFWRGSNIGNHSGSGLGLYICRQLMKRMEGDIFAKCDEDKIQVTVVFRMI